MAQIILTDDQLKATQSAVEPVEIRDERGTLLGYMARSPGDAEMAEAQRRLQTEGPWYSTQQVLSHLRSLEQE